MKERKPVAVVAGAGPGNGAALARRFAIGGYAVALLARNGAKIAGLAEQIDGAVAYACDVSDPASVDTVFDTIIPRNVRLAEAPSFGKPIILYDIGSVGAKAYMQVAKELIAKIPTGIPHAT